MRLPIDKNPHCSNISNGCPGFPSVAMHGPLMRSSQAGSVVGVVSEQKHKCIWVEGSNLNKYLSLHTLIADKECHHHQCPHRPCHHQGGESWWHVLHWSRHWQRGSRYLPHSICWSLPLQYNSICWSQPLQCNSICWSKCTAILSAGHQHCIVCSAYQCFVHFIWSLGRHGIKWYCRVCYGTGMVW